MIGEFRPMYTATVEDGFSAAHHVRISDGGTAPQAPASPERWEDSHSHDWRVRACFARNELDACDMVVDFCSAANATRAVLVELQGTNLNEHPAFRDRSPTAELVARYIFDQLASRGFESLVRVEVTEAPGCTASYGRTG